MTTKKIRFKEVQKLISENIRNEYKKKNSMCLHGINIQRCKLYEGTTESDRIQNKMLVLYAISERRVLYARELAIQIRMMWIWQA